LQINKQMVVKELNDPTLKENDIVNIPEGSEFIMITGIFIKPKTGVFQYSAKATVIKISEEYVSAHIGTHPNFIINFIRKIAD